VGLAAHELWHQVQHKTNPLSLLRLGFEFLQGELGDSSYKKGDPTRPEVLATINVLSSIPTLEGQAQFIGFGVRDVFLYKSGKTVDPVRLQQEAQIILNSGYSSMAVWDILHPEKGRM